MKFSDGTTMADLLQRTFNQYHGDLGYPLDDPTLWERIADELPEPDEPPASEALDRAFNDGYRVGQEDAAEGYTT